MTQTIPGVLRQARENPTHDRSFVAKDYYDNLMSFGPDMRREWYRALMKEDPKAMLLVTQHAERVAGTAYGLWTDDPVGFVEDVLHETTWSKQRDVLSSLPTHKRTAVPSAFGTGKTHIAARAALWRSMCHPIGTSLTVTTATRFRQVQRQLWPHIRRLVKACGLPLIADQTQLRAYDLNGVLTDVAYGFSAPPYDESAVQGIHAPALFLVVDEAGGMSRIIGSAMRGLMTGSDTRLLAIGNPPTDDEGSWFEQLCGEDDVGVVRISAYDAPKYTGEQTKRCLACPRNMPRHPLSDHIVDDEWVNGTIKDHGEDAPFVIAKVHAKFPKGGPSRTIPSDWVDLAVESPEPEGEGYVKISDVVPTDPEPWMVKMGAWIRMGVDVASDGGDEMVVSRMVGDLVTVVHTSSGATNTNAVDVAGKILVEIKKAELVRVALGTTAPVRVKIDAIGVGWGVASTLIAWGTEGIHNAEIVPVIVSEDTYRDDEAATMRPFRKRDELWLTGRAMMQPRGDTGRGLLRLRIGARAQAQLSAPTYSTNSGGRTVIESKKHMRERGIKSPDQAEAILMAPYEPVLKQKPKGTFKVIA